MFQRVLVYALLILTRSLPAFVCCSLFAQVSNVFALAVVFWFDFSHSESVPFIPKEFSLKGMPFFFAVAIYCYEVRRRPAKLFDCGIGAACALEMAIN